MTAAPFADLPEVMPIMLALALGLLVGVQRGWALRREVSGSRFAGVRTYGLIALAGGFAGAFKLSEPALSLIVLASGAGLILLGYWRTTRIDGQVSGTASLVALLTLACGYLAGAGEGTVATVATGLIILVLAARTKLHGWVASLSEKEVAAIARFALIALVVLPLLPDTPFGPYGVWRARQLWLVVVMVSGFSFVGYLAAKHFGATRGVLATAAAGAVVSSTAVTVALAGKLKAGEGDAAINNGGIVLASVVMYLRVMILTAALAPFALRPLATVAIPGMLVSLAATVWIIRKAKTKSEVASGQVTLRNPFDLGPALLLTALVMALSLAARWVLDSYGQNGVAMVLAITGTVDVDSAIITMGNLPPGILTPNVAGLVLAVPIQLNTLLKASLAVTISGGRRGLSGAAALLASLLALVPSMLLLI